MSLGNDCLFEAIRKHPYQAMLYVNRIPFEVHNGHDPMSSFRRAADLAAKSRRVYQTAFNSVRPQWGGSLAHLREVYSVVRSNSPGEDRPRTLRNQTAPEATPFIDLDSPWTLRAVLDAVATVIVPAGAWAWRNR